MLSPVALVVQSKLLAQKSMTTICPWCNEERRLFLLFPELKVTAYCDTICRKEHEALKHFFKESEEERKIENPS